MCSLKSKYFKKTAYSSWKISPKTLMFLTSKNAQRGHARDGCQAQFSIASPAAHLFIMIAGQKAVFVRFVSS